MRWGVAGNDWLRYVERLPRQAMLVKPARAVLEVYCVYDS
jgi:phage terminase small subunit